jgi:beta-phosphoglucomutase family hydrolase
MSSTGPIATLSPREYDAVLFDMDGVLTQTASIHAGAWKQLFDAFLERRSVARGETFVPFDIETDYRRYVDGKPRSDGVEAFLRSRGIDLPQGTSEDGPEVESVHGLGNRKDRYFMEHLERHGVQTFEAAVDLVRNLRTQGVRTAVVTSSINCETVLREAGIADLFDVRVDGTDITRLGLPGKPAPDAFLEAARRMHAEPSRSVVVEDAIVGVKAGRAGGFGLVIGVDHVGDSYRLREAGADIVVTTLAQVHVATEPPSAWSLIYEEFDPAREGIRESLCALGNGYFATRGAAAWADADAVHYPGTYLAGGYNRLRTDIKGRVVENEDLVNLPNWLSLTFRIEHDEWFDLRAVTIRSYRQELDLRRGALFGSMDIEDAQGRRTEFVGRRFVSMRDMHLGALELAVTAKNWSGRITIRSAIDGRVVNAGAKLYREFNNRHLRPIDSDVIGEDGVLLRVRTSQSDVRIAQAAVTRAYLDEQVIGAPRTVTSERGYIAQQFTVELRQGATLKVEKLAFLYTSRDFAISECGVAASKAASRAERFDVVLARHVHAWTNLWRRFDIRLQPAGREFRLNLPMLLRLNMFHLLQAASFNSIGLDIGVPARGWTGEAYQGHVFWDELFIFPALNYRAPELTRSLLIYRYRRLKEARAAAAKVSLRGAMFPWQSGSDGQEETQELNLNHRSQRWIPDNSFRQRHVGSAVAYNVWQYFQVTQDFEFLHFYGAEMILDIAHFWSSIAIFSDERQRYEIRGVMGPDEFHEAYPDSESFGLNNNAYTNVMAVWVLLRALDVLQILSDIRRRELLERLTISATEIERWEDLTRRMFVPFHDNGIISQFEGYESLREFDWEGYRLRYGNIGRLDLILEAENDSMDRYKLGKQADVLMLFYVFSAEELTGLFERLGYLLDPQSIPRNVAYYDGRSSHGSTLSRVVHAWVMARSDRPRSLQYYAEALQSDVSDIQQGTTAEGIHLGAMAGTVDLILRVSTGIEATGDVLRLNPQLPPEIQSLDMRIRYRGHSLDLQITRDRLTIHGRERGIASIKLGIRGETYDFACGSTREFSLT